VDATIDQAVSLSKAHRELWDPCTRPHRGEHDFFVAGLPSTLEEREREREIFFSNINNNNKKKKRRKKQRRKKELEREGKK
jgi:hypothetical protein